MNDAQLAAFSVTGVGILWFWSLIGKGSRNPRTAGELHLYRYSLAASYAILPCLGLAIIEFLKPAFCHPTLVGGTCSFIFLLHAWFGAKPHSIWNHRRFRLLAALGVLMLGTALPLLAPIAEFVPFLFAAAIFHHYHTMTQELIALSLQDLEAMRQKLQTLQSRNPLLPARTSSRPFELAS